MNAIKWYFTFVLFIMLYKGGLGFQSVDGILKCYFSMQSLTAVDESAMCDQLESGYWLPVTDSLFGIQNTFLRVKTQK